MAQKPVFRAQVRSPQRDMSSLLSPLPSPAASSSWPDNQLGARLVRWSCMHGASCVICNANPPSGREVRRGEVINYALRGYIRTHAQQWSAAALRMRGAALSLSRGIIRAERKAVPRSLRPIGRGDLRTHERVCVSFTAFCSVRGLPFLGYVGGKVTQRLAQRQRETRGLRGIFALAYRFLTSSQ